VKVLENDTGATKISDLAFEQGYWHMSQFASDYQRLFGEFPSTTLQR
jgi:AraC family ethanolamine operon transcriptional activator